MGPKTRAAIGDFQQKHGLEVDFVHGPATEAKLIAVVAAWVKAHTAQPAPAPAPSGNKYGLSDVRGLQKIAKRYGYAGGIDNVWGSGSQAGFDKFLATQGGLGRWLRAKWGYVGNDVYGPNMRAALARANTANFAAL
jgi:peptidoglycan hydrolase-like protein with peptidoglycan-binding domain